MTGAGQAQPEAPARGCGVIRDDELYEMLRGNAPARTAQSDPFEHALLQTKLRDLTG